MSSPPFNIPRHNLRKVSIEAQCGDLKHQRPQDSSFSTLPNLVFHAGRTLRGPRWALLLGVTKLKLWSVWKVYWACTSWVLGVTEYIDSLYGEHRDHGDHGNNWWSYILTRWWPPGGGRSVRFGALTTMLQVLILIQIQIQMQIKLKYR